MEFSLAIKLAAVWLSELLSWFLLLDEEGSRDDFVFCF